MTIVINEQFTSSTGALGIDDVGAGYSIHSSQYLKRSYTGSEIQAILYGNTSTKCHLEIKVIAPRITTTDYCCKFIYQYATSVNFRYVKIAYNNGLCDIRHWKCIAGVHTQLPGVAGISGTYSIGDVMTFILQMDGNTIIQLRAINPNKNYDSATTSQALDTTELNTNTKVGFAIDPEQVMFSNTSTSNSSEGILVDYFVSQDVNHYYGSVGGGAVGSGAANLTVGRFAGANYLVGGSSVIQMNYNSSGTGGARVAGSPHYGKSKTYQITGSYLLYGVPSHLKYFNFTATGSYIAGSNNIQNVDYVMSPEGGYIVTGEGAASEGNYILGGTAFVQFSYRHTAIANYLYGSTSEISDRINGRYILGGFTNINWVQSIESSGGFILSGNKYANDYKYKRIITIPADTFSEQTEYYLGIKATGMGNEIYCTDTNDNVLGSQVRQYCPDNYTHVFINFPITTPESNTLVYLYHN